MVNIDTERIKRAVYIDLGKLAKVAGYNEPCSYYYDTQDNVLLKGDNSDNWNSTIRFVSIPDLLELIEWLSENKVYVYARHYVDENGNILFMSEVFGKYYTNTKNAFKTYLQALYYGVEKALKENFD